MKKKLKDTEAQAIDRIISEYQQKGYRVIAQPSTNELPVFLRGFAPDLVAHSETEHVVIEVKSSGSLERASDLVAIAKAVESQPAWRFELVSEPLLEDSRQQFERLERMQNVLPLPEINRRLDSAQMLITHSDFAAATLVVWIALEATLRRLALAHDISLTSPARPLLLKTLVTQGVITRTDYQSLAKSLTMRNRIAHGQSEIPQSPKSVAHLISLTRRLLEDDNKKSNSAWPHSVS